MIVNADQPFWKRPIVLLGGLFFLFGFVTWLNAALIPYLKLACELSNLESYLVAFAFYISYFVMAIPSSWVLQRTHLKQGMVLGLMVMAIGALLFIPAAYLRTYGLFLTGLFITGAGLALLQTAANPYVTMLGPVESGARRISIMGICNKTAGAISPYLLGSVLLANADKLQEQLKYAGAVERQALLDALALKVIPPYVLLTLALAGLALWVRYSPLPDLAQTGTETVGEPLPQRPSVLHYPHLVLGVVALFFYVGAEVIAGDTIIAYGIELGFSMQTAKTFTTFTLLSMLCGYLLAVWTIPRLIRQEKFLLYSAMLGLGLSVLIVVTPPAWSVASVALLGLANAVMWPAIWPLALYGLGNYTKLASALLIMAIAGGALLPLMYGHLADRFNAQSAYLVLLPCYLIILIYAWRGHRIRHWH
ncbi:MAG: sugar MFS transporter [Chitinophagales bacterium]|nr:sugar MFS transporter [Chitinophagales bacterium]MDW8427156.1 sugar MFS transporter [Chitinophagales bacterium]